jgi:hypothetical protein
MSFPCKEKRVRNKVVIKLSDFCRVEIARCQGNSDESGSRPVRDGMSVEKMSPLPSPPLLLHPSLILSKTEKGEGREKRRNRGNVFSTDIPSLTGRLPASSELGVSNK